jgi:hypothetical protein
MDLVTDENARHWIEIVNATRDHKRMMQFDKGDGEPCLHYVRSLSFDERYAYKDAVNQLADWFTLEYFGDWSER